MRHLHLGGRAPDELEALSLIKAFGVSAVLGYRILGLREMRSLLAAQNIQRLYADWQAAEPRLIWEFHHPEFTALLEALDAEDQHANS